MGVGLHKLRASWPVFNQRKPLSMDWVQAFDVYFDLGWFAGSNYRLDLMPYKVKFFQVSIALF